MSETRGLITDSYRPLPRPRDEAAAKRAIEDLRAASAAGDAEAEALHRLACAGGMEANLLGAVFGASPFLASLIHRHRDFALRILREDTDELLGEVLRDTAAAAEAAPSEAELKTLLRRARCRAALLIALADIAGAWDLDRVTGALSDFADHAVQAALSWLNRDALRRGKATAADGTGHAVLAMGKLGARELNYSSDIDLIVLFDPDTAPLETGVEPATYFVRLTKRLVSILQDYTGDGYVFRVDLRLRPDPRATQIAIAIEAAGVYYESMGQNWERAAMIKARPIAGDLALGDAFLKRLKPYVWRKYLDFAAIADVQSLKRQIHAVKGHGAVAVAGHDIKLGRGGIREIEFFAQTQQLIAGGRNDRLRGRRTLDMLDALAAADWISGKTAREMKAAYRFLRRIEHRLQMMHDEQTQTLPESPEALEALARFAGFDGTDSFDRALRSVLNTVQQHYAALFEDAEELAAETGNLVFTGADDDPGTLQTLGALGFSQPREVSAAIRSWHFGRYPATRSNRAKELLTELMPALLKAIARAGDADAGFIAFDRFLAGLPAGLQLFSMLKSNPHLLDLLAMILGSAPRLAAQLSSRPRIFDAVLDPGFFDHVPEADELRALVADAMPPDMPLEEVLDRARAFGNEQMFRIGVRVLSETIDPALTGAAYSDLADVLIARLLAAVREDLRERHGTVPGGQVAVVAMGKLGGREMTASSDVDLVLIYDHEPESTVSDGRRGLAPTQYFARLTQRLIAALSSPTAQGVLYEVDMRLRPSGNKGPVASHVDSFAAYHRDAAWTWEQLALTRARVIAGGAALERKVGRIVDHSLRAPHDAATVRSDAAAMRARMLAEHGGSAWNLKQARGGLVDIEFIVQAMQVVHAAHHPGILHQNTARALARLREHGLLGEQQFRQLDDAGRLYHGLTQILRLCVQRAFAPDAAPEGLQRLLANAAGAPDLAGVEARLAEAQDQVAGLFDELVAPVPAGEATELADGSRP